MITKLINRVTDYVHANDTPVRLTNFALFRICFFSHILLTIYNTNTYKGLLFDSISGITKNPFPFNTFIWIWALCAFMMLIGWCSKYFSIVQYICVVIAYQLFNRSGVASYYNDLMLMASFLCIFFPVSASFSVDALIKRVITTDSQPRFTSKYLYSIFIFLTLGLMYFGSGMTKIGSPIWQHGLGLWIPLCMPFFKWHGLANYVADFEWLLKGVNYFVILWELVFVVLLFTKRLRTITILIGIAFHTGIALFFYFPEIALASLIFYLLFIPDSFWSFVSKKIQAHHPLPVFIPEDNVLAQRAWAFLLGIDFRHKFIRVYTEEAGTIKLNHSLSFTQLLATYLLYRPVALFIQSGAYRGIQRSIRFMYGNNLPSQQKSFTTDLKKYVLVCFVLSILSIQCYVSARFLLKQLTTKPAAHLITKRTNQSFNFTRPSQLARSLFGINSRGLFLDNGIAAKRTMITIACVDSVSQQTTWLPLLNSKGYHFTGEGAWTKTYSHYLYQQNPLSVAGLEKVIRYWSSKNHQSLYGVQFIVLKRNYPESNHFETKYWQKMEDLPWDTAGVASWQNNTFRYVPVVKDSISVK